MEQKEAKAAKAGSATPCACGRSGENYGEELKWKKKSPVGNTKEISDLCTSSSVLLRALCGSKLFIFHSWVAGNARAVSSVVQTLFIFPFWVAGKARAVILCGLFFFG